MSEKNYKQMWERLKQYVENHTGLVANWCGGCEICARYPDPGHDLENCEFMDILSEMNRLEESELYEDTF